VQSMTIKHSRKFENSLGSFTYTCVDRDYFPIGLRQEEVEGMFFVIASPEKALCDLICSTAGVNLRYKKEAETFLEQDLRLDMDALRHLDASIFQQCAAAGKKTQTIMTLLKLLEP